MFPHNKRVYQKRISEYRVPSPNVIENQLSNARSNFSRLNWTVDVQTEPVYISDSPPIEKYLPPKEFKLTPIETTHIPIPKPVVIQEDNGYKPLHFIYEANTKMF